MKLVDSHIHLDFPAFDSDRAELIASATAAGIECFVVPATTRESWPRIDKLVQSAPTSLLAGYGLHPYFVRDHSLYDCVALDSWIEAHSCVAVGEIGLDYFLKDLDPQMQMRVFTTQLAIAKNRGLPVILHARKAVEQVIGCLKKQRIEAGIVHSFSGSHVQAMQLIDMGFKLGFGGALTYPRATRLRAMVKALPLSGICLETDAPDQPPSGYRGRRNEPLALVEVLETVAELHQSSVENIARQSTANTYAVLNIC